MFFLKRKLFILYFIMLPGCIFGQHFFRIEGDITIKEKNTLQSQLTVGRFFFDKNIGKLVYAIDFPEKQIVVSHDTTTYHFIGNALKSKTRTTNLSRFTIFNLVLNHDLEHYGLENTFYHLENVEKDKDLVIMTWLPDDSRKNLFGKVLLSTKSKKLHGVVIYNSNDEIISKQFFEEYKNINGLNFPHKIVKIAYAGDKKNYQIITFENVKLNNLDEKYFYDYPLPLY